MANSRGVTTLVQENKLVAKHQPASRHEALKLKLSRTWKPLNRSNVVLYRMEKVS